MPTCFLWSSEEVIEPPGTVVMDVHEQPCKCYELNPRSFTKATNFLTNE